jgi:HTH-type transcriptional regulator/antitoxin HipB
MRSISVRVPKGNEASDYIQFQSKIPVRGILARKCFLSMLRFPYGNLRGAMKITVEQIGALIRATRKGLGVTQRELALTSGTGLRFVVDLERGKETCEIGKALTILQTLGIKLTLVPPSAAGKGE